MAIRILFLTPVLPGKASGGAVRVDSQLSFLAGRHEVSVASFNGPAEDLRGLRARAHDVEILPSPPGYGGQAKAQEGQKAHQKRSDSSLRSAYFHLRHLANGFKCEPEEVAFTRRFVPPTLARQIIERVRPDCLIITQAEFAYLREAAGEGIFCVYDSQEVRYTTLERRAAYEWNLHWRLYWAIESRRMKAYEAHWAKQFDLVSAISRRDECFFRMLGCENVSVFPEGSPVQECRAVEVRGKAPVALFLGNFTNVPNVDAVEWFVRHVWPVVRKAVPRAEFHVAGVSIPGSIGRLDGRDGIRVLGFVDDLGKAFGGARVFVLPMRMGGGQKVKLAQALAAGLPVVSTPEGCEGMTLESGRDLLVESSKVNFASAVVRLFEDDDLAESLGRAGRARVEKDYNRQEILGRFENALLEGVALKGKK